MWKQIDKINSNIDNTVKYVFEDSYLNKKNVVEVSYINKEDGKDIICVPTQTSCNMGCKFCHLTGLNLKAYNLSGSGIGFLVYKVVSELRKKQDTLLISYMGAGEPLRNVDEVIRSAVWIRDKYSSEYKTVRFAVASIVPDETMMKKFMEAVNSNQLEFKFHLSLHSVVENNRRHLMPRALNIKSSVQLLEQYSKEAGKTEVHYTLMDGVNDSIEQARALAETLKGVETTVKFLKFSPKSTSDTVASTNEIEFIQELNRLGITTEVYSPPGRDIGSSCGQFNVGDYMSMTPAEIKDSREINKALKDANRRRKTIQIIEE